MNFPHLLHRIWPSHPPRFLGVEMDVRNGEECYHMALIRSHEAGLEVMSSDSFSDLESLGAATKRFGAIPVLFHLTGAGSIERLLDKRPASVGEVLGVEVENEQDFLLQYYQGKEASGIAGIIRTEKLEECIKHLPFERDRIVSISTSPGVICGLLPHVLPSYEEDTFSLSCRDHAYHFHQGNWISQPKEKQMTEKDLASVAGVSPTSLLLMAQAVDVCYSEGYTTATPTPARPYFQEMIRRFKLARVLRPVSWIVGALLICIMAQWLYFLLGTNKLEKTYQNNRTLISRLQEDRTMIQEREALKRQLESQTLKPSHIAWALDQIADTRTGSLVFHACVFNPDEEERRKMNIQDPTTDLVIQGTSQSSADLSSFSSKLERQSFVRRAHVINSQYDFRTRRLGFTLLINLK